MKGPTLEQFVKNCSPCEGFMLEEFVVNYILWTEAQQKLPIDMSLQNRLLNSFQELSLLSITLLYVFMIQKTEDEHSCFQLVFSCNPTCETEMACLLHREKNVGFYLLFYSTGELPGVTLLLPVWLSYA
ncbi:hypothetical protein DUI87_16851 [Hirundo rustica rustica]|uniref:Uncharacterized protein n=1 Tax=Hirundo rustica rustica TaxID=333673 RepID=A0A3M0K2J3_HIRRU|nr:hypothetical protein DUI87_16851 [Hirundo rustica rustica]